MSALTDPIYRKMNERNATSHSHGALRRRLTISSISSRETVAIAVAITLALDTRYTRVACNK